MLLHYKEKLRELGFTRSPARERGAGLPPSLAGTLSRPAPAAVMGYSGVLQFDSEAGIACWLAGSHIDRSCILLREERSGLFYDLDSPDADRCYR